MKKLIFILAICVMFSNVAVHAQSCLGEVVHFRETFGAGTGITQLAAGRTNYVYKQNGSLSDGDYHLHNTTQGRPEWHNVPDHTGDVNGRMMVTNASYTPGEFYRDTVFGLTATKTYTVYFYAMNVNTPGTCSPNPILPRLELVVESYNANGTFTQLSSIISDSLPQSSPAQWVRISGTYYLPVNVNAIRYRIINNSTGGCGNDVAIDDITFSQCQPVILPVSGLSLKGTKKSNNVILNWTSKDNYASFEIERSAGDHTWELIKSVQANSGKQYQAEDNNMTSADVQYRVAAINAHGIRHYSNIINIKEVVAGNRVSSFPNPFNNSVSIKMNVENDAPAASIKIIDMQGRVVSTSAWNIYAGENNVNIATQNLHEGIYLVSINDRSGALLGQQRIMKNRQ